MRGTAWRFESAGAVSRAGDLILRLRLCSISQLRTCCMSWDVGASLRGFIQGCVSIFAAAGPCSGENERHGLPQRSLFS